MFIEHSPLHLHIYECIVVLSLYIFLCSKQDMLEILKDYGKANITPAVVARVLGMMAHTHSNLPESIPYLVS